MATIFGTPLPDVLSGTVEDDKVFGLGGNDTIFGSRGNDFIDGGTGIDTVDYNSPNSLTTLGPIRLLTTGIVDKGKLGQDQLRQVETIIAPKGLANTIDASTAFRAAISVDLARESLVVTPSPGPIIPLSSLAQETKGFLLPTPPDFLPLRFTVKNFVNVTGTGLDDQIAGDVENNHLSGGSGNDLLRGRAGRDQLIGNFGDDFLDGGSDNDVLLGTDAKARGRLERDSLVGGSGHDDFILGDKAGAYYKDAFSRGIGPDLSDSANAFAQIKDFGAGDQIQLGANEIYQIIRDAQGFDIYTIVSGSSDVTRPVLDLIADVQTRLDLDVPTQQFSLASGDRIGDVIFA